MKRKIKSFAVVGIITVLLAIPILGNAVITMAASRGFTVSPMAEEIILYPGESVQSSFMMSNPVSSTLPSFYELNVKPFYIGDNGQVQSDDEDVDERYNMMVDWIKFDVPVKGKLEPNESMEVKYTISVPDDVSAGGQYAMITVTSAEEEEQNGGDSKQTGNDSGTMIKEKTSIGHLVYAEIAGNTVRSGDILEASVPGFLLDGNIRGSATVKNTGNVHGEAKYTLKIFPLFSSEEVYTNEEKPDTKTVLPDRNYYSETSWEETPGIGIFNVVYKVEFQGETQEVSKMVIKVPVWLLFLIVFVIVLLIVIIVFRVRKKSWVKARNDQNASS